MGIRQHGRIYFGKPDKGTYIEGDPDGAVRIVSDNVEVFEANGSGVVTALPRSVVLSVPIGGNAKVGATAGWVITGATNINHATLPASQTASTLVVPIAGLQVGDIITAAAAVGQIESGGNAVGLTMSLRKVTAAAAAIVDAEVGAGSVSGVVADAIISAANVGVTGLSETVGADEMFYLLFTGTTLGSTDIDLMGALITVTRP